MVVICHPSMVKSSENPYVVKSSVNIYDFTVHEQRIIRELP